MGLGQLGADKLLALDASHQHFYKGQIIACSATVLNFKVYSPSLFFSYDWDKNLNSTGKMSTPKLKPTNKAVQGPCRNRKNRKRLAALECKNLLSSNSGLVAADSTFLSLLCRLWMQKTSPANMICVCATFLFSGLKYNYFHGIKTVERTAAIWHKPAVSFLFPISSSCLSISKCLERFALGFSPSGLY